ncbi:DUF692 domain-containing protein [Glaciecola sp. 1036]|uniref:DUF692 domain-containing protein n=1 Tax=Alteromonadaceae TaxID=72275 RepID=UPI003D01C6E1
MAFHSFDKPNPFIGVGLRHPHYQQALDHQPEHLSFVEIHAENFFASGGITKQLLADVRNQYEISVHGTSLGLGSQQRVPPEVLEQFSQLVAFSQPCLVSEHLCFNRALIDNKLMHSGDLLPIPYNKASLELICGHINEVQDAIRRPLLIENLSAYLQPTELAAHAQDDMTEVEFWHAMCRQSGCGILLDINNLIVNALNQKVTNVEAEVTRILEAVSPEFVGEIHLAGFTDNKVNGFIVDDHGAQVSELCWKLYQKALKLFGNLPTLVEWDTQLPSWETLTAQSDRAYKFAKENG